MKIEKLDNKGRGITYYNNLITFVNNALPDEEVEISLVSENKKFYIADAKLIKNENINRVLPKCPYYYSCGGCNYFTIPDSKCFMIFMSHNQGQARKT